MVRRSTTKPLEGNHNHSDHEHEQSHPQGKKRNGGRTEEPTKKETSRKKKKKTKKEPIPVTILSGFLGKALYNRCLGGTRLRSLSVCLTHKINLS